jgi:hypothetical protein
MKTLYKAPTGAQGKSESPLAPSPSFPERVPTYYERKAGPDRSGQQGPARFYEGLATDTDLPNEFRNGAMQGYETAAGRPNHNKNVYEKWPAETMRERDHAGSASWTDSPTFLGDFSHGTDTVLAERAYEQVDRGAPNPSGRRWERMSPAEVRD